MENMSRNEQTPFSLMTERKKLCGLLSQKRVCDGSPDQNFNRA